MSLDFRQTPGHIFLGRAGFGDHGKGGVEFFARNQIEIARYAAHPLFGLRAQFMPRFGKVAENSGPEGQHIFGKTFIGHRNMGVREREGEGGRWEAKGVLSSRFFYAIPSFSLVSLTPYIPMQFPNFDPVAVSLGPLVIRWYALAYLTGFVLGWRWCMAMARQWASSPRPEMYDEFLTWAVLGVILGGRIGYVLFYNGAEYWDHPLEALKVWHGGMSFHGGMSGVIIAAILFTRKKKISFFAFTDLLACVTPIGLGLGRLANFVNGELFGRVTDEPWGIVFPRGGDLPRHPSQLYEAGAEGLLLLLILFALSRCEKIRTHHGVLSGAFLLLYGMFRFSIEFFREPDAQLGFLFAGATMGQLLCIPMMIAGICIIIYACRKQVHEPA